MWIKISDDELLNSDSLVSITLANQGNNGASVKALRTDNTSVIIFSDRSKENCDSIFNSISEAMRNNEHFLEIHGQHTRRVGTQI